MGFFDKIKQGFKKTSDAVSHSLDSVFAAFVKIDEDLLEELEEALILSDVGASTSAKIVAEVEKRAKLRKTTTASELRDLLREVLTDNMLDNQPLDVSGRPAVILVIGVNGVGKTTSIGKLAARYVSEGKKVMLSAADTFRAAAADQLEIWAKRAGADIVRHGEGADPAAVVFDSISAAKARGSDIIIVDTAGRLHNKANLMNELAKIDRVISRELPDASRETLLVLDATTGQNAVHQAEEQTAGNEFGMEDGYYNTYIGRRLAQQAGKDAAVSYDVSPEYDDLRCLFAICRAKQMQILFVHVPMHGAWSDYTGFSAERRQTYYENVRRIAAEYENVTLLDLTGYEYEPYFLCDTMHLGWKGWLAVDKAIAEFWEAA